MKTWTILFLLGLSACATMTKTNSHREPSTVSDSPAPDSTWINDYVEVRSEAVDRERAQELMAILKNNSEYILGVLHKTGVSKITISGHDMMENASWYGPATTDRLTHRAQINLSASSSVEKPIERQQKVQTYFSVMEKIFIPFQNMHIGVGIGFGVSDRINASGRRVFDPRVAEELVKAVLQYKQEIASYLVRRNPDRPNFTLWNYKEESADHNLGVDVGLGICPAISSLTGIPVSGLQLSCDE